MGSKVVAAMTLALFSTFVSLAYLLHYPCIQVRAVSGRSSLRAEVKAWGQVCPGSVRRPVNTKIQQDQ